MEAAARTKLTESLDPARAYGGKNIYGAAVGVLMAYTRFPRLPGDMGNAGTWPFPVVYKIVREALPIRIVTARKGDRSTGLLDAYLAAADELIDQGVDGITTNCGFLSIYQQELAEHCKVPVAASSLMQIPLVERLLPPGKRVGVLTYDATRLSKQHLLAAGAREDTPVVGTEHGRVFWQYMRDDDREFDVLAARQDVLDAAQELVTRHDDIGAVVLECTNMPPFARALHHALRLPVYDIYSFITWFQTGLQPRAFGTPGDPL